MYKTKKSAASLAQLSSSHLIEMNYTEPMHSLWSVPWLQCNIEEGATQGCSRLKENIFTFKRAFNAYLVDKAEQSCRQITFLSFF